MHANNVHAQIRLSHETTGTSWRQANPFFVHLMVVAHMETKSLSGGVSFGASIVRTKEVVALLRVQQCMTGLSGGVGKCFGAFGALETC